MRYRDGTTFVYHRIIRYPAAATAKECRKEVKKAEERRNKWRVVCLEVFPHVLMQSSKGSYSGA